jgi:DegV family protein with EDD domain
MSVAIVTDSTACLPAYRVAAANIHVIPVQVTIDDQTFDEGINITSLAVASALTLGKEVTTNKPNPEKFIELYQRLHREGAQSIVSIHLSSELSSTYSSAVMAARESGVPVHVVDSRTIGMGLGFAVLAAVEASTSGASAADVAEVATRRGRAARAWLYVDSLDHLRRGGRIGDAQALVGTALSIKPILEISGGKLVPRDKVRTSSRAVTRMIELVTEAAHEMDLRVEVAVQHVGTRERADSVVQALGKALPGIPIINADLGAVLAAHAGPGALAVVVSPVY